MFIPCCFGPFLGVPFLFLFPCSLARAYFETGDGDHSHLWTAHVVSRSYRAPELIVPHTTRMGFRNGVPYSAAIDVWAAGCIFAELFMFEPLFGQARDQARLLEMIFDLLGAPLYDVAVRMCPPELLDHLRRQPARPPLGLSGLLPGAPAGAVELIARMLVFDPDARISAAEAAASPYFNDVRQEVADLDRPPPPVWGGAAEPPAVRVSPPTLRSADFDFETRVGNGTVNAAEVLRQELLAEIACFHPEGSGQVLGGPSAERHLEPSDAAVRGGGHPPPPSVGNHTWGGRTPLPTRFNLPAGMTDPALRHP